MMCRNMYTKPVTIVVSALHANDFVCSLLQSHHCLELLAEITGKTITEIMEPHKEVHIACVYVCVYYQCVSCICSYWLT